MFLFDSFFVLEISILLPPSSLPLYSKPALVQPYNQNFSQNLPTRTSSLPFVHHKLAPQDTETNQTKLIPSTTAHSLKAAIFHTMAFKILLEMNNDQITSSTKRSFLKVLYYVCKIKKKNKNFEQYARLYLDGPKNRYMQNRLKCSFCSQLLIHDKG